MAQQSGSSQNEKKRRLEEIEITTGYISQNIDSWARFLVIEAADKLPIKLNPFAISKAVSGICGEVKNVTHLRSGSLLVECARRQQSLNLLSISTFANIEVAVSVHRTLNSCRGIVCDRARCLSDMSEEEIVTELGDQAVTEVKRFTMKKQVSSQTTDLTWVKSEKPVATIQLTEHIPATHSSSGSQTEIQPEKHYQTSMKEPVNQSKKGKKKLNRKQAPIVPSPSEVPLQNSFGPLDMEVTLSSPDRRRSSSSSHSRERSPIEPP
ncbi:uncharacterized protein [Haliotis cracherodii]|uniref:uncharacterized protein n=1 Tax=Haliotis cracherodii TaxID=6455 RepID=UPI0039E890DE